MLVCLLRSTRAFACAFVFQILFLAGNSAAVEIIGHRGASYDAPENTLAAVNLAWKQNADAVEIDCYLSKDGKIVVVHDKTTKRYGGPNRKIVDQTFDELRKIDVGTWKGARYAGERIPTLAEVVATIPESKRLFIEIKCGPEIVPKLKRVLNASGKRPEQTAIISFSHDVVSAAKKAMPRLKVFWVVGLKQDKQTRRWKPALDTIIRRSKAAGVDGVDLSAKPVIDAAYVKRCKQAGLGLYVWTVNSRKDARRLVEAGVDGITTDRPGYLREYFDR